MTHEDANERDPRQGDDHRCEYQVEAEDVESDAEESEKLCRPGKLVLLTVKELLWCLDSVLCVVDNLLEDSVKETIYARADEAAPAAGLVLVGVCLLRRARLQL